jgi:ATP-binding cassette subfamily B multidrug efflux pump
MEEEKIGNVGDSRLSARLLRYLRPYRWWVIVSACLLIAHSLLAVVGPYLTMVAIDRYLSPQPESSSLLDPWLPDSQLEGLNAVALLYLAALLAGFAFRFFQTLVMNYTGQRVMRDLRKEIFGHMQTLDIQFYDRNPLGRLVTRVTTDVDTLNEMFTSGVVAIFGDVLTLTFILLVMLNLSPMLTLVLMTVAPLVIGVSIWFRKKARESYREVRVAVAKLNSFLQEHLTGVVVVQLFNHERRSARRFDEINAEHRDAYRKAIRAHAYFFPAVEWLGMLAVAVVLVYGGYRVVDGGVTIGIVVAFIQYGTRVFRPIQDLSEKYNILQSAMASSERIFSLLDTAPAQKPVQPAVAGENGKPAGTSAKAKLDVEFQNVWFAYKDKNWVLRDVSFRIEAGETVAIVGHTGAGKTTIISLLLRFYDIQKGKILVAGRDIRDWPVQELRRSFGVVLQDSYLFEGTIGSNIRFGNDQAPGERLEEVARDVNLSGFIGSLAGGFEEPLKERGSSLSSGQKQLIGFARALVHNPGFLILDEATSSVDTDTEMKIRDALSRMVKGHTSIIVAHRLSTIHRADRILVTHKGKVRESGTHQELLAKKGIYWRLYQLQYRDQEGPHPATQVEAGPANRGEG